MSSDDQLERLIEGVRTLLRERWDPIGVKHEPRCHDEYDAYAGPVVSMLHRGASADAIAEHLICVARERMGLESDPEAVHGVAQQLVALRDAIE